MKMAMQFWLVDDDMKPIPGTKWGELAAVETPINTAAEASIFVEMATKVASGAINDCVFRYVKPPAVTEEPA